jgi:hypothetical protein
MLTAVVGVGELHHHHHHHHHDRHHHHDHHHHQFHTPAVVATKRILLTLPRSLFAVSIVVVVKTVGTCYHYIDQNHGRCRRRRRSKRVLTDTLTCSLSSVSSSSSIKELEKLYKDMSVEHDGQNLP